MEPNNLCPLLTSKKQKKQQAIQNDCMILSRYIISTRPSNEQADLIELNEHCVYELVIQ